MTSYIVIYDKADKDCEGGDYVLNRVVPELFDSWKEAYAVSADMRKTNNELDYTFYDNIQIVEVELKR